MGIERTDLWLEELFDKPLEICGKFSKLFGSLENREIYEYLKSFGMYTPRFSAKKTLHSLKEAKKWEYVEKIFSQYKSEWNGPDVPVFIFPFDQNNSLFSRKTQKKSGVSFPNQMFLFLASEADEKEVEAVFVHEYHHVCRLNKRKQNLEHYTLLDSIIIEGLAEYTVQHYCGEDYIADWCKMYKKKNLVEWCHTFIEPNLKIKKSEKLHDVLLYGKGPYPKLLGYAAGYEIVSQFYSKRKFSAQTSFLISSEKIYNEKIH